MTLIYISHKPSLTQRQWEYDESCCTSVYCPLNPLPQKVTTRM